MRTFDLPVFALAIRAEDEGAFVCAYEYTDLGHGCSLGEGLGSYFTGIFVN